MSGSGAEADTEGQGSQMDIILDRSVTGKSKPSPTGAEGESALEASAVV